MSVSAPPTKGHGALKSSVYNTTNAKYATQSMMQDHMNTHYKRLLRVKSTIDNSVPKTALISTKARDAAVRRSRFGDSLGTWSAANNNNKNCDKRASTLRARPSSAGPARSGSITSDMVERLLRDVDLYGETGTETSTPRRPQTASYPPQRAGSVTNRSVKSNSSAAAARQQSGDPLERKSHVFSVAEKPFTPRTLKNSKYANIQSHLSRSGTYTAPKRKPDKTLPPSGTQAQIERLLADQLSEADESQLTATALEETAGGVTARPQPAVRGARRADPGVVQGESFMVSRSSNRPTKVQKKISEQEDESKYLAFVSEVTADVFQRGITTNKVLKRCFDQHVVRKRGVLEERKMRTVLDDLRQELGIPSDDDDDTGSSLGMSMTPAARAKYETRRDELLSKLDNLADSTAHTSEDDVLRKYVDDMTNELDRYELGTYGASTKPMAVSSPDNAVPTEPAGYDTNVTPTPSKAAMTPVDEWSPAPATAVSSVPAESLAAVAPPSAAISTHPEDDIFADLSPASPDLGQQSATTNVIEGSPLNEPAPAPRVRTRRTKEPSTSSAQSASDLDELPSLASEEAALPPPVMAPRRVIPSNDTDSDF